jgi:large repetitive protein
MSFFDGAILLGTKTVSGTLTSLQTANLITAGTHSITASFDRGVGPILTSPTLPHTVLPSATSLTVSSSRNPSVFTQKVTLKATVKRLLPAKGTVLLGTVTFYDGATAIATHVPVSSGVAKFATAALSVGDHAITAEYSGSPDDGASVSVAVLQHVDQAATFVTLTSSLNPSTLGQAVTLKATVKRASPAHGFGTGTVDFYDGATAIAIGVALSPKGIASITTSALTTGDHAIEARYSASATDRPSHAAMIQHVN